MVRKDSRPVSTAFLLAGLTMTLGCAHTARAALIGTPPASVTTYRVYELAMSADVPTATPYATGPAVTATFTGTSGAAAGKSLVMKGFWDGGNVWRIRFAPTATGDWSWTTSSTDPGLNNLSGSVTAVAPTPTELSNNILYRGFLERDGYAWKLSDGTLFLPVGDTQWSFSEEFTTSEWQQWMTARQSQKFNTFLGCIWLAIYSRAGVPEAFPSKNPQTENLNVAFFQRLDQMVQYANDRGIMMGLTIGGFPDNSNWWVKMGTLARNDRWFRYCVARYTAYNVRWVLYGEVNERNPPGGWGGGITTWQGQVARDAQLVKDEDPYDHPVGSHHTTMDSSSANNANIDYIEVQIDTCGGRSENQYLTALNYRTYGKPVWFEEYWYENTTCDNEYVRGVRLTHRNFIAAMAFPTMASLMRNHFNDSPPPDVGLLYTDPGAIRMAYFYDFYKNLDFRNFTPSTALVNVGQCGKFGSSYAIMLQGGGNVNINLTGVPGSFAVTRLDINTGVTASLPIVNGGATRTISTGVSADVALLLTPTAPPPNAPPTVSAGANQTVIGPTANLDGTVTDDGLPFPPGTFTVQWTKFSGPGTVTFGNAAAVDTTATFGAPGSYVLRLTASDTELSASGDTTVAAIPPGDMDADFDVDQTDFGAFQRCLSGSGVAQNNVNCAAAKLDIDADVDDNDFSVFAGCMSGPGVPGNLNCRTP